MIWENENGHMTVDGGMKRKDERRHRVRLDGGWNCIVCKFFMEHHTRVDITKLFATYHKKAKKTSNELKSFKWEIVPESTMYRGCWSESFIVLSFLVGSLIVLWDEIVLLDDVIARRLFKALLPRINVLLVRIAGLPAEKIESPERDGNVQI